MNKNLAVVMKIIWAAIYIRVSTEQQILGKSLEEQERLCIERAQCCGYKVFKVYTDISSAMTTNRPAFLAMLADAENLKFEVLIVRDPARLFRDEFNAHGIKNYWRNELKIQIIYDAITYEDPFYENMDDLFNAYSSIRASERTRTAKRYRAVWRKLPNGSLPIGYEIKKENDFGINIEEQLVPDFPKVGFVQKAFSLYETGRFSDREIAMILTEHAKDMGIEFSHYCVNRMLKNPIYTGKIKHKNELFEGGHYSLISDELFDACQLIRKDRANRPRAYGFKAQIFPLERVIRCFECNADTWCHCSGANRYYQHPKSNTCSCSGKLVRAEIYERQVDNLIEQTHLRFSWQRKIEELVLDPNYQIRLKSEISLLQERLIRVEKLDGFSPGLVNEITCELRSLVIPRNEFVTKNSLDSRGIGFLWAHASVCEKRTLITILFNFMQVDFHDKRVLAVNIPECFECVFNDYIGAINVTTVSN